MKTIDHIRDFLDKFVSWGSEQADIQAIALVGSYARGAARDDSDIDLVILTDQPQKYLNAPEWIKRFGSVDKHLTEDYGKLTSLRVWYQDGVEVEYGITMADSPVLNSKIVQKCDYGDIFSHYSLAFDERIIRESLSH